LRLVRARAINLGHRPGIPPRGSLSGGRNALATNQEQPEQNQAGNEARTPDGPSRGKLDARASPGLGWYNYSVHLRGLKNCLTARKPKKRKTPGHDLRAHHGREEEKSDQPGAGPLVERDHARTENGGGERKQTNGRRKQAGRLLMRRQSELSCPQNGCRRGLGIGNAPGRRGSDAAFPGAGTGAAGHGRNGVAGEALSQHQQRAEQNGKNRFQIAGGILRNQDFLSLASAASSFLTNFAGSFLKSFRQSLQQSWISRPSWVNV
jgi:hypothetical protein